MPNCWRFRHPAKYCRSTARCPLCALPGHTHTNYPSTIHICANCTQEHNVFFRGCSVYKFKSEIAALGFKHDLTLKEAKQEARLCGFQQVLLSQCISINTPQTVTFGYFYVQTLVLYSCVYTVDDEYVNNWALGKENSNYFLEVKRCLLGS